MEVFDAIKTRRSSRWFTDEDISKSDLLDLVDAGIYAPSASNSQNQRFLVVTDKRELERIGGIRYVFPYKKGYDKFPQGLIGMAKAAIVVFADNTYVIEKNIWDKMLYQNAAASIQNILLVATSKGIGSCWISATPDMDNTRLLRGKTWRDVFPHVPDSWGVYGIVILGYPKIVETKHAGKTTERKERGYYLA